MKSLVVAALSAGASLAALGEPETYTVDPSRTVASYEVTYWGLFPQQGRFEKASGRIVIDLAQKKGRAEIVIDTASVASGMPVLDEMLRGEDFFHSEKYPRMTFRSENLLFEGAALTGIAGDFTMRAVTRPMTFRVSVLQCQSNPATLRKSCHADIEGTLRRSEFGLGYRVSPVSDDVTLRIGIEATRD